MTISEKAPFSYLGIDWGEKKVGVAVADSETRVALPLATIPNNARLLESLARIFAEHAVRHVVIGIPSHVNRAPVEYGGEQLGALVSDRFHLTVSYENEMFTTKMARAELVQKGVRSHLDDLDDAQAARIILESFLAHRERI